MSEQMPEACPFCGAGVLILDDGTECRTPDGSHLAFQCFTNWFKDRPADRSDVCEQAERNNLIAERDRLRERVQKLVEAGDNLDDRMACGCHADGPCRSCRAASDAWTEAKEAKP